MRIICLLLLSLSGFAQQNTELRRYTAPHAKQGVVVDPEYFYVITNDSIIKHERSTGNEVAHFHSPKLKHLNSGSIIDGKLYCAHSNYPEIPMWNSIEIFDPRTMRHIGSHSFGIGYGSCTWMVEHEGFYYVMFAHYGQENRKEPNRDVSWTQLVKYDKEWRRVGGWVLPPALIERCKPYSLSGGVILPTGALLCTHHHNQELYLLEFPEIGSELIWKTTIPSPIRGQAICTDPSDPSIVWGIDKEKREVIQTRMVR
jgi:hypothetical protein